MSSFETKPVTEKELTSLNKMFGNVEKGVGNFRLIDTDWYLKTISPQANQKYGYTVEKNEDGTYSVKKN